MKRARSGRELVEHGAERELIRPEVERPAGRLFGRHVTDRAGDSAPGHLPVIGRRIARDRLGPNREDPRETEVEDLDEPVVREHQVFGFQVPVHDPRAVRLGQAVRDLGRNREEPPQRDLTRDDQVPQADSFDELHGDVEGGVGGSDLVNRHDVRVVQGGRGPRFPFQLPEPIGIRRERRRQDLDRDFAAEARVARSIDLPHSSLPERGEDLVGTETASG